MSNFFYLIGKFFLLNPRKNQIDRSCTQGMINELIEKEYIKHKSEGTYIALKTIHLKWYQNFTKIKKGNSFIIEEKEGLFFLRKPNEIITYEKNISGIQEIFCIEKAA